jgi:hypothetical protein
MYAKSHQSKRMTWFGQHDDFRFFFPPQNMATLGPFFPKAFFVDAHCHFFFHQVAKIGAKKKKKKKTTTTTLWSQNVNTLDNHSLYLFI